MAQLERSMYWPFRNAFNYRWRKFKDCSYHKDPDTSMSSRLWYDAFAVNKNGQHIALEYKINNNKNTFSFKTMFTWAEHELRNLKHIDTLWWKGWVIVKFSEYRGLIKYFSIQYVLDHLEEKIPIQGIHGASFDKVDGYLDISPLL